MTHPNTTELEILKHLWSKGRQSAREIHESVGPARGWKPSTTRTLITRMEAKTLGGIVRHLARSVLDMNGPIPASFFADSPHLTDDELDELDAIINAAEAKNSSDGGNKA